MAEELTQVIHLRRSPGALLQPFFPGDILPDWAWEQVKDSDHLFEEVTDSDTIAWVPKPSEQVPGRDYESGDYLNPNTASEKVEDLDETIEVEPDEAIGDEDDKSEDAPAEKSEDAPAEKPEDDEPNRGASKAAWTIAAEKAIKAGYPVVLSETMGRNDIIKAMEDAGAIEREKE